MPELVIVTAPRLVVAVMPGAPVAVTVAAVSMVMLPDVSLRIHTAPKMPIDVIVTPEPRFTRMLWSAASVTE